MIYMFDTLIKASYNEDITHNLTITNTTIDDGLSSKYFHEHVSLPSNKEDFYISSFNANPSHFNPDLISGTLEFDMPDEEVFINAEYKRKIKSLSLRSNSTGKVGGTLYVNVSKIPSDSADPDEIIYKSSDQTIATVDSDGKCTFLKEGTVFITVTLITPYGTITNSTDLINVVMPPALTGIEARVSSLNVTDTYGSTIDIYPIPREAILPDIKFSLNDPLNCVVFNSDERRLYPAGNNVCGKFKVTATTVDNEFSDTVEVCCGYPYYEIHNTVSHDAAGGSSTRPKYAIPGDEIKVSASDASSETGFFEEWKVTSGGITLTKPITERNNSFIMPSCTVRVEGKYGYAYDVEVIDSGEDNTTNGSGLYRIGDEITVNAGRKSDKTFERWECELLHTYNQTYPGDPGFEYSIVSPINTFTLPNYKRMSDYYRYVYGIRFTAIWK